MITVPEITEEIIKESPYLESAIASGLINLSSLARKIQPQIQKRLLKDIKFGAIIMALKRLEEKLKSREKKITPALKSFGDLTVKSNLVEFTFRNSQTLLTKEKELLQKVANEKGVFLTLTQSLLQTSLIISASWQKEAEKIFEKEKVIFHFINLSAITLILSEQTIKTPGAYYFILKILAWYDINIIEVVSSFTELTLVFESKDIDRAFSILKNL